MKLFYITLNTHEEAKAISYALLEQQAAVCTNWFPMTCAYRWKGEIKHEPEILLIVKTKENMRTVIEKIISQHINYTNCIAELNVNSINKNFLCWLEAEVSDN